VRFGEDSPSKGEDHRCSEQVPLNIGPGAFDNFGGGERKIEYRSARKRGAVKKKRGRTKSRSIFVRSLLFSRFVKNRWGREGRRI